MPVRVKTESGALVTIPDDFYDPEVHTKAAESDAESPLLPDGVTYRPPTYPSKTSAKKSPAKKAAKKAPTKKAASQSGQTAESTKENG